MNKKKFMLSIISSGRIHFVRRFYKLNINYWEHDKPLHIKTLKREIPPELGSAIIGRYFTFSGFLNLLETLELSFNKISNFEDQAEGVPQYKEVIDSLKAGEKNVSYEYAQNWKNDIIETIDCYYASCWTMNEHESYLMWKNYTNFNEGILIVTTIESLLNSLEIKCYENNTEIVNFFYGKIDYNYQQKMKSDHIKAFGKSKYFIDENEFRVVIYHHPIFDQNTIRCSVKDLSFIQSIICSPGASREFAKEIDKIVKNYSIQNTTVKESEIKQNSRNIFDKFLDGAI